LAVKVTEVEVTVGDIPLKQPDRGPLEEALVTPDSPVMETVSPSLKFQLLFASINI
jgi:hypothetical protein